MIKVSLPSSIKTSFIAATLLFTGENLAQTLTFDPLDPFENIDCKDLSYSYLDQALVMSY